MFEQAEQQAQQEDNNYIYGAPGVQRDPEVIKWQLSGADLIEEIKHRLLGEVWDEENETWIQGTDPLLNEQGINDVIAILNSHGINKNTILATLEEQMVFKIMTALDFDLSDMFAINHRMYGIQTHKMTVVKDAVCNQCYFAMTRAIGGGEKKFLSSTEHRQYNFNTPMQGQGDQKRRTFFGIPLPGVR